MKRKSDSVDWKSQPGTAIVCYCQQVTKTSIVDAVLSGCNSLEDIQQTTGAGIGDRCKETNPSGKCYHRDIIELIKLTLDRPAETGKCNCCCGK